MLHQTCRISFATSFNTVKHRPAMLDSTVLDDVEMVWPGLLGDHFKESQSVSLREC